MLLERVGKPVEQQVTMIAVMGTIDVQCCKTAAPPQLVEPVTPPRAVVEQAMQIAADDRTALRPRTPPAEDIVLQQWLQARIGLGDALVQFKTLHAGGCRPAAVHDPLPQG